jgi:hypothetical protein
VESLRIFGKVLLVGLSDGVRVYDSASLELEKEVVLGFSGRLIENPLSYKNKVLVSDGQHVALVNIQSGKKLFSFQDEAKLHKILHEVSPINHTHNPYFPNPSGHLNMHNKQPSHTHISLGIQIRINHNP